MKKVVLYFSVLLLFSCTPSADIDQVFTDFSISAEEIPADGQSMVNITVKLNDKTDVDRRNVIFKTSGGIFISSSKDTEVIKAEYEQGRLVAKTTLKVSTKPGNITLSVAPEYDSKVADFVLEKTIAAVPSKVSSLNVEPSSFGIGSNYLTEVQITGNLRNSAGKFVSNGHKVVFNDFLADGSSAGGAFREVQAETGAESKVSCYYAATQYPIGTAITIRCTVVDENNLPTALASVVKLTINQ
ncbi:hypothetical protein [Flavobacterium sp. 245]|uniref:hypothetical protein n=1 Tax=Flavobacterium sp. 245 TaxID=2512115 RepID=UPI00106237C1|nr:hypothetical protein [Flavobacterium sp. 245]TDO94939.1 hypothetical protein EV145_11525 [Flavobacterium sp. 245]